MIQITEPTTFERIGISDIGRVKQGRSGVYFIESCTREVIYIGKTVSFRRRLREHVSHSFFSAHISSIRLYDVKDELSREIYETYLINKYKPYYNVSKKYERPSRAATSVEYHEAQAELNRLIEERTELLDYFRDRDDEYFEDEYEGYYDDDDCHKYLLGDDLCAIGRLADLESEIRKARSRVSTVRTKIF